MTTFTGTSGPDVIVGHFGDIINAGGGDDVLSGASYMNGEAGNDILNAPIVSTDFIFMSGGLGDDVINGNNNSLAVALYYTAAGPVHVDLSLQGVQQNTGEGNDTLTGVHNVVGSTFDDVLLGGSASEGFSGGPGNDTINGGGGFDLVDYTADFIGAVFVDLAITTAQNTGSWGSDTISNVESVSGTVFDDTLSGDASGNLLLGQDGNDILNGRGGNDTLDGGAGSDTATYFDATGAVTIDLSVQGNQNTVGSGTDALFGIENVIGSAFADQLSGSSANNSILGLAGNDTIAGGSGGSDFLDGGLGTDTLTYASAGSGVSVNLTAIGFFQHTVGSTFELITNIENVTGSAFNDVLTGDGGANLLAGGFGNDTLDGGGGNDTLDGGGGIDLATYAAAAAGVSVNLSVVGPQNTGGAGSESLTGIENLIGSNFNDTLTGDGAANVISGGQGVDVLQGGGGNDTLDGGAGSDTAAFTGAWVSYNISTNGLSTGSTTVADTQGSRDGTDTVTNIETYQFSNGAFLVSQIANDSPVGVDDTAAIFAVANFADGSSRGPTTATGSVVANDTDPDSTLGDTHSVNGARAGTEVAGGALQSVAGATVIAGTYGALTIQANGTYSYALDNTKSATQALAHLGGATTDVFTYQVADAHGLTDKAQISIRITGGLLDPHDFNGDGKADILWRNANNGDAYLFTSSANAVAAPGVDLGVVSGNWHVDKTADFNGDGRADILWRNTVNGDAYLFTSSANAVATPGIDLGLVPLTSQVQAAADFNGDGKADILWRDTSTGDAFLWNSSANAVAAPSQDLGVVGLQWQVQAAADFNGDGKADILWRNMGNGDLYLFNSSANALAAPGQDLGVVSLNNLVQEAADFNGDGKADILWRNMTNGDAFLWTSSANAVAAPSLDLGIVAANWSIV